MFLPVHQEYITYDLHKCEWVLQVSPSVCRVILLCSKIFYCVLFIPQILADLLTMLRIQLLPGWDLKCAGNKF